MIDPNSKKGRTIGWIFLSLLPLAMLFGYWLGSRSGVTEVETDRLVCGVTRRGISCVPKIPELWSER